MTTRFYRNKTQALNTVQQNGTKVLEHAILESSNLSENKTNFIFDES
jgi:hypothetical protein